LKSWESRHADRDPPDLKKKKKKKNYNPERRKRARRRGHRPRNTKEFKKCDNLSRAERNTRRGGGEINLNVTLGASLRKEQVSMKEGGK